MDNCAFFPFKQVTNGENPKGFHNPQSLKFDTPNQKVSRTIMLSQLHQQLEVRQKQLGLR
jgi:hypothetical protein